jgi:hypothetical protein
MRIKDKNLRHLLIVPVVILTLALSACGAGNADATPTLSVDAIFTAAFETLSAQQATQLALTPPTETPAPTPLATATPLPTQSTGLLSSPTTSSGGVQACNSSAFVNDVTIPDGTQIKAGKTFIKTWTIQNNGTCDWSTSYKFSYVSGDQMGGSSVTIPKAVASGQTVEISVTLTAPTTSGDFKGFWRMQTDQGQYFGDSPWVAITVSGGEAATNTSSGATDTPVPTVATTASP